MSQPPCSNTTAFFLCQAAFYDSLLGQAVLNSSDCMIDVNDTLCKMLGQSRKALLSKQLQDFSLEGDDPSLPTGVSVERRFVKSDGAIGHTIITVSPIKGNDDFRLAQVQCVTALKNLQADLQRNAEDLEQFAYIASHDLREPLTAMAGFATLLKRKSFDNLDKDGQHFLDEIIASTKRMECKIEDLLAFSRAGKADLHRTFPLGNAVEEAKKALVKRIKESEAEFDITGELPLVRGDRSMVAQVFQNLFSNSIKYRKGQPKISIRAEPYENQQWLISVRDDGIGFDMRHKDRIFGVFTRLYTTEQFPGTGIGLAIAKRIVDRHWGSIWAESAPGQGATFFFTLPVAHEPLQDPPSGR